MNPPVEFQLHPARVARTLAAAAAVLVLIHLVAMQVNFNPALGLKDRFGIEYWHVAILDLDEEESFGTWFSSGLLAFAGLLLLVEARAARSQGGGWAPWWLVLAVGFFVLSMDEVAGMHEYVNTLLKETPWTVFGAAILAVVGLAYLPFLRHHRGRTALLFVVAGAVYGGGAVGVEHFTGADVNSLHYNMWTALEEGMEMAGVILFIYALLDHLRGGRRDGVVRIDVTGRS